MKKAEVYGGDFLKAQRNGTMYIPEIGERYEFVLTIKHPISTHEFDDGKKQRVLSFHETELKLGLNATNWDAIANFTGKDDDDHWIGEKVELFVVPENKSQTGQAIRVRKPRSPIANGAPAAAPAPIHDTAGPAQTFGPAGDSKLTAALALKGLDINHLRAFLNRKGAGIPPSILDGSPMNWPLSCAGLVKTFLEAPPEVQEDDIPF